MTSKLDYSSFVYGSARQPYISKLENLLQIKLSAFVLGVFRTSPTTSLQVLCHQPPLELRCDELALKLPSNCKKILVIRLSTQFS